MVDELSEMMVGRVITSIAVTEAGWTVIYAVKPDEDPNRVAPRDMAAIAIKGTEVKTI